jgi:cobyrinic acid a,c-diamide synthase
MGLVPTQEHEWAHLALEEATRLALAHIDMQWLTEIADSAAALPLPSHCANDPEEFPGNHTLSSPQTDPVRIGVIRDSAFQFYYPENLEALERCGATLTYISALEDIPLPPMDALYIGGGFPETHAERLAANTGFRNTIRKLAEDGMPIYAECGGLMFLGQSLVIGNARYPMAGVLPIVFGLFKRPQGHGYTEMLVDQPNPFYSIGTILKGHEFHYSKALECPEGQTVFAMKRGSGLLADRDGFCMHQTLATYTHIHALGTPQWAPTLIQNAITYRRKKSKSANALIV